MMLKKSRSLTGLIWRRKFSRTKRPMKYLIWIARLPHRSGADGTFVAGLLLITTKSARRAFGSRVLQVPLNLPL
jgi:hypothetical protein